MTAAKATKEPEITLGPCCFCNEQILASSVDPCAVTVSTPDEHWQVWHCHAQCFRERLFPREDGLFEPARF